MFSGRRAGHPSCRRLFTGGFGARKGWLGQLPLPEVELIWQLYNQIWERNWGFAPMTEADPLPIRPLRRASQLPVRDGANVTVCGAFARFNAIYPNVKITYEPQPDNFQTKIKADFAGSTEPDVFYLDSSLMTALAPEGLLLPLDDAMQAGSVKADDYVGELVSLFQADGKTYALPKDQGSLALFVNNDMAQKAGVDPASLKTWDDVTAAAQKMTSGEGPAKVYGMCANADSQRGTAFILQTGNPIIEVLVNAVLDVLREFIRTIGAYPNHHVLPSRRRFIAHLERGDADAAVAEMEASLKRLQRTYLSRLKGGD